MLVSDWVVGMDIVGRSQVAGCRGEIAATRSSIGAHVTAPTPVCEVLVDGQA